MPAGLPSAASGGRGFMIGLTLTEIALLLFFVLLLLVNDQERDLDRHEEERQELLAENRDLRETQQELQKLREAMQSYREQRASGQPKTKEDFVRLLREAQQAKQQAQRLEEERSKLREANEKLQEENRRLRDKARDTRAQLARVQQTCGPEGHGPPPCWVSSTTGEIEYAFEMTIHEEGIEARPIWPEHRRDDAQRIPGMADFPTSRLSLQEFRRHAAPILAWSRRQDPECRHYVRIYDEAVTKEAFKQQLLGIEGYFYKWLSP